MKLVLHIGTPKSGTTYIQNSLIANKIPLESLNIYYAQPKDSRIAPMAEVAYISRFDSYFWERHTSSRKRFIRQQIHNLSRTNAIDKFIASIKKHEKSKNIVIISSENLCFMSHSAIKSLLKLFCYDELLILETRKPTSNLIRSLYWQTCKIEQTGSYGSFIRQFIFAFASDSLLYSPFFYLTQDYLNIWSHYGVVKSINAHKLYLKDFISKIGCEHHETSYLEDIRQSSVNSTPSINFIEAVKTFWNLHPRAHLSYSNIAINKSRQILINQPSAHRPADSLIPPLSEEFIAKFTKLQDYQEKDLPYSKINAICEDLDLQYQECIDANKVKYYYELILSNYNKFKSGLSSISYELASI